MAEGLVMRREEGYSYVIVMFMVAVQALLSVRAMDYTLTRERRDKESELLEVGGAYARAIRQYHDQTPGGAKKFPLELTDLLYDDRLSNPLRPLRKLYRDPITGSAQWGEVRNEAGALIGVFSLSTAKPLKQGGFIEEFRAFTGAQRYQDWKFVYQP